MENEMRVKIDEMGKRLEAFQDRTERVYKKLEEKVERMRIAQDQTLSNVLDSLKKSVELLRQSGATLTDVNLPDKIDPDSQ